MAQFLVTFCIGDGINDEDIHVTRVKALVPSAANKKVEDALKELFGGTQRQFGIISVQQVPVKEWLVRISYVTSEEVRIPAESAEQARAIANNDHAQERCCDELIDDYTIEVVEECNVPTDRTDRAIEQHPGQ